MLFEHQVGGVEEECVFGKSLCLNFAKYCRNPRFCKQMTFDITAISNAFFEIVPVPTGGKKQNYKNLKMLDI